MNHNQLPIEDSIGFLTDNLGRKSAIRLYGLITLLTGLGLSILATIRESEIGCITAISLIGIAFTGKVTQKKIEQKDMNSGP